MAKEDYAAEHASWFSCEATLQIWGTQTATGCSATLRQHRHGSTSTQWGKPGKRGRREDARGAQRGAGGLCGLLGTIEGHAALNARIRHTIFTQLNSAIRGSGLDLHSESQNTLTKTCSATESMTTVTA